MATSLPSPGELTLRCAVCHDKPVAAQASLAVFASTKLRMRRAHRAIQAMKTTHPEWSREALERFHDLERALVEIELEWHTLDTHQVIQDSKDVCTGPSTTLRTGSAATLTVAWTCRIIGATLAESRHFRIEAIA